MSAMTSSDDSKLLLPSACDHNLDDKLRNLLRTSEINLTRVVPHLPSPNGQSQSQQPPASPGTKHTITISITSSSASHQSPAGSVAVNCNQADAASSTKVLSESIPSDRKKKLNKKKKAPLTHAAVRDPLQQVIYAPPAGPREKESLFRHRVDQLYEFGDELDNFCQSADSPLPLHQQFNLPLPAALFARTSGLEHDLCELRSSLMLQKWFLSKWIGMKKKQLHNSARLVHREVELEKRRSASQRSVMKHLLQQSGRRDSSSIRNGICCFCTENFECKKPCLPFTRHCKEHILYNVDQLLFTRCTAKSASSLTQCSSPTFDIQHDDPICEYHMRSGSVEADDGRDGGRTVRKRTKQMALTRPGRRKKRKGKGHECASDSAADYSNGTDENEHMPPPPPYPTSLTDTDIPAALDVDMPNLGPSDEALVASLVDDLGPLPLAADHSSSAFDAELITDVLNKMPADAFNELFADHPISKGSASETEAAIDQSFSSKNCHLSNGEPAYPFMSHPVTVVSHHLNGHIVPPAVHSSPRPLLNPTPLPNDDLVNNILGFLTTEQQQQLNGLIDGALASGSLTSPALKQSTTGLDMHFPESNEIPQQLMTTNFKTANPTANSNQLLDNGSAANSHHPPAEVSAPFTQFNSTRVSARPPAPYPNTSLTASAGSLIISGLNEASIGRSNQFVRLSDMRLNHPAAASAVIQSPVKKNNCAPRPGCHSAHPLPSLAAAFEKKTS